MCCDWLQHVVCILCSAIGKWVGQREWVGGEIVWCSPLPHCSPLFPPSYIISVVHVTFSRGNIGGRSITWWFLEIWHPSHPGPTHILLMLHPNSFPFWPKKSWTRSEICWHVIGPAARAHPRAAAVPFKALCHGKCCSDWHNISLRLGCKLCN